MTTSAKLPHSERLRSSMTAKLDARSDRTGQNASMARHWQPRIAMIFEGRTGRQSVGTHCAVPYNLTNAQPKWWPCRNPTPETTELTDRLIFKRYSRSICTHSRRQWCFSTVSCGTMANAALVENRGVRFCTDADERRFFEQVVPL